VSFANENSAELNNLAKNWCQNLLDHRRT